jgi:threonine/homoserine/homoserine lactone efflux protein
MHTDLLIPFFVGMMILAATPGPGVFASMATAIADGFKASLFLISGLVLGDMMFLLLALFGLSAVATMSNGIFLFIKVVGGIYLMYLGVQLCRAHQFRIYGGSKYKNNGFQTCISGFLVTLGNPKPILFYASVLPTIIDVHQVHSFDILIMLMLIAVVSVSVLGTYCYIASLSRKISMTEQLQKRLNWTGGIVLMIVGLYILCE